VVIVVPAGPPGRPISQIATVLHPSAETGFQPRSQTRARARPPGVRHGLRLGPPTDAVDPGSERVRPSAIIGVMSTSPASCPGSSPATLRRRAVAAAVYEQLRRAAQLQMAGERADHTLQATAWCTRPTSASSATVDVVAEQQHFYAAAAEAMRRIR